MQIRTGLLLLLVAAHVATGCSSAKSTTNTKATQKVGAKGGSLTLGTGVSLQIPAGALSSEVELGVEEVTGDVAGFTLGSKRYRFTPEGTTFAQPVKVSLEQTSVADSQSIFWSKAGGGVGYDKLATTACGKSPSGKSLFCAETSHFSVAFLGSESAQPQPSGSSGVTCSAPETKCGASCVNTQSSTAHCGACNAACGSGQECNSGVCQNPARTVSISVTATTSAPPPSQPTRAEGDHSISFVGRKVGTAWQDVPVATGANTSSRTYTFSTREPSFEVVVGCDLDLGTYHERTVRHFLKHTESTPSLSVICGRSAAGLEPGHQIVGTIAGEPPEGEGNTYRYTTIHDSRPCPASVVRTDVTCEAALAPDSSFDVLYGLYDTELGTFLSHAVVRNQSHVNELATAVSLPFASMVNSYSAVLEVDLNGRTGADVSINTASSYFATSRGRFESDLQGPANVEIEGEASTSFRYNFNSIVAGAIATDAHEFDFAVHQGALSWYFTYYLRGTLQSETTANTSLPAAYTPDHNEETGALGGVTIGSSKSGSVTLEQAAVLNDPAVDGFTWESDIDASAVTGSTTYPFAVQALNGLTGATGFSFTGTAPKTYQGGLVYETQNVLIRGEFGMPK